MKRNIISIDTTKCNGCGLCIPGCPEGALQIIDGKARLVSDLFCDGLGACIGECPEGAIAVEEREAEPYDEIRVMENIVKQGENTIGAHLKHLKDHNETEYFNQAIEYLRVNNFDVSGYDELSSPSSVEPSQECGSQGSMTLELKREGGSEGIGENIKHRSELQNWPVQLQLINPRAPYFKNAHLVIAADCVPFSYPNFHRQFIKDRILIIFCPKLDRTIDSYIEKLSEIFKNSNIQSISTVHMEVPCCSGVERVVEMALQRAGKDIPVTDTTISIKGDVIR
jgi:Pyruvate/2-oxoacid:ferredoxin oxidoreductase delta subunit